jgi:large subunit ribosomal protein L6
MSRIGRQPIAIPKGVEVKVREGFVDVKGPKGSLTQFMVAHVGVTAEGGQLLFTRDGDHRVARANHGLMRALVSNMVKGVSLGFEKKLQIEGTGFRAEVKGRNLLLTLGFSHPIEFPLPTGIDVVVDKQVFVTVKGIDRQQVGQVAAVIRKFRTPDSYKGKGVRYADEKLRIKEGKSA